MFYSWNAFRLKHCSHFKRWCDHLNMIQNSRCAWRRSHGRCVLDLLHRLSLHLHEKNRAHKLLAVLQVRRLYLYVHSWLYHLYFIQVLGIKVETKVLSQEYRGYIWFYLLVNFSSFLSFIWLSFLTLICMLFCTLVVIFTKKSLLKIF